jgi:two-component system NarL family sensor kinase
MNKEILKLSLVLIVVLLFHNCQTIKDEKLSTYKGLFEKSEKYTRAEYDSVYTFYKHLDSIQSSNKSPIIFYLKKIIEANLNYRNANYDKSNTNLFEAIQFAKQVENSDTLMAKAYSIIGKNFTLENKFDSAFYYFHKAVKIYDTHQNENQKNVVKGYMANAYYFKGDNQQANLLVDEVIKNSKNNVIRLNALHQKANILGSTGAIDQAIQLDQEVIKKYEKEVNPTLLSPFYNNLGLCYSAKNDQDQAIENCLKSFHLDSISGIRINAIANLVLLADISLIQNNTTAAKNYNSRALNFFNEHNNYDKKLGLYQSLENILLRENDLKGVMACKDSILSQLKKMNTLQDNHTINLLKIEYETDKKNQQIIQQQIKIDSQKRIVFFMVISTLLLLLVFYFNYQNRQKKNKLAILEQENKISDMLFIAEQSERKRIASDLHNGINQKLAVISMYLSSEAETSSEKSKLVASIVQETIEDVRTISHNLYPTDLNKGLIKGIRALCEQNNFLNPSIKFQLVCDPNLENTWSLNKEIELVMYRIIQEFLNNALKYSQSSLVKIEIFRIDKKININIEDNGLGFKPGFKNNEVGIGLKNCEEKIQMLHGKMILKSAENQGTKIHIEIPE